MRKRLKKKLAKKRCLTHPWEFSQAAFHEGNMKRHRLWFSKCLADSLTVGLHEKWDRGYWGDGFPVHELGKPLWELHDSKE